MAKRQIRTEGNIAFIPLTQGYEAVIDAADVPLVEEFNWCALITKRADGTIRSVYAVRGSGRRGQQKLVQLHATLCPAPPGYETDHRDGDGLNCRKTNLRVATHAQNQHNMRTPCDNRSGYKGVHWCNTHRRWVAQIRISMKRKALGTFRCKTAAAVAYAKASREIHGEFGRVG